ncbi:hypothetical protein PI124_g16990 [Phytophthora idaei]|nr:hypothetical protein PI125_g22420 [Phytophthora idaei]KAG3133420.1 hypothetical protein PI126_g19189 [Phytophthora idaei]KAG3238031.1 hypothetical protein PI124_g16990 [Phytophthora idaei]
MFLNAQICPMDKQYLVFSITTSSPPSERAWSIFDFINSKKRNRLSARKVDMLPYIYINYDLHAKVKPDLARLQTLPEAEGQDSEIGSDQEALIF